MSDNPVLSDISAPDIRGPSGCEESDKAAKRAPAAANTDAATLI
jgi:hypothetical protein